MTYPNLEFTHRERMDAVVRLIEREQQEIQSLEAELGQARTRYLQADIRVHIAEAAKRAPTKGKRDFGNPLSERERQQKDIERILSDIEAHGERQQAYQEYLSKMPPA